mmetsp:Transcript_7934/g.20452  ORF Transcript_7934/g.20452 Transcript_7934/m.20452 type:complete len:223 (+) Transcript_7934:347-1015(+)
MQFRVTSHLRVETAQVPRKLSKHKLLMPEGSKEVRIQFTSPLLFTEIFEPSDVMRLRLCHLVPESRYPLFPFALVASEQAWDQIPTILGVRLSELGEIPVGGGLRARGQVGSHGYKVEVAEQAVRRDRHAEPRGQLHEVVRAGDKSEQTALRNHVLPRVSRPQRCEQVVMPRVACRADPEQCSAKNCSAAELDIPICVVHDAESRDSVAGRYEAARAQAHLA